MVCNINQNNEIYFLEQQDNKNQWFYFGIIVDGRIEISIEQKIIESFTSKNIETFVPEPTIEFFIELGEKLKNEKVNN